MIDKQTEQPNDPAHAQEIENIESEIAKLPPEKQAILFACMEQKHIEYSGPIPPPSLMAEYEKVLPGSADRIIAMAERQSEHRQSIEKTVVENHSTSQILGVIIGGIIALACIVIGGILIYNDKNVEGLVTIISPLAILVGVFIKGDNSVKKELKAKEKQLSKPPRDSKTNE